MQGFSEKFTGGDDGLCVLAINDFPCLAKRDGWLWEIAVVCFLKLPAAPDAFLVDGGEGDGLHECQVIIDR